jgi:hypothetical protein
VFVVGCRGKLSVERGDACGGQAQSGCGCLYGASVNALEYCIISVGENNSYLSLITVGGEQAG